MKYLLATVDKVNEFLNRASTTEYADGEYATLYAADTVATNDAVARLIKKGKDYTFAIITTPDTDSFSFKMSAAGTFTVDWGDGEVQEIVRTDTESATYSHTYARARKYKIEFEGQATEYSPDPQRAAILFASNSNIRGIRGSLGAIFSTIGDGSSTGQQPGFDALFASCTNLTGSIPSDLFTGVHGQPVAYMFRHLFYQCRNLTGSIPAGLFAGVSGTTTLELSRAIFTGCGNLTGPIPTGLFAGVSGPATHWLFAWAFAYCTGLTGPIPADLFGNISGPMAFKAFRQMFEKCPVLTGESAKINGKYLYEIWPESPSIQETVKGCYYGDTNLSDYADIPEMWKRSVSD